MPDYDRAVRRRAARAGRERGRWVYIPAVELEKTGHGADGADVFYRVWAGRGGRVVVQLYRSR